MQRQSFLNAAEAPAQRLPGWATIRIGFGHIDEVPLAEEAHGLVVGGLRSRYVSRDTGLLTRHDLLAVEVTAIGDDLKMLDLHGGVRTLRHRRQPTAIVTDAGDVVVDDQVVLGVHCQDIMVRVHFQPAVLGHKPVSWIAVQLDQRASVTPQAYPEKQFRAGLMKPAMQRAVAPRPKESP